MGFGVELEAAAVEVDGGLVRLSRLRALGDSSYPHCGFQRLSTAKAAWPDSLKWGKSDLPSVSPGCTGPVPPTQWRDSKRILATVWIWANLTHGNYDIAERLDRRIDGN